MNLMKLETIGVISEDGITEFLRFLEKQHINNNINYNATTLFDLLINPKDEQDEWLYPVWNDICTEYRFHFDTE